MGTRAWAKMQTMSAGWLRKRLTSIVSASSGLPCRTSATDSAAQIHDASGSTVKAARQCSAAAIQSKTASACRAAPAARCDRWGTALSRHATRNRPHRTVAGYGVLRQVRRAGPIRAEPRRPLYKSTRCAGSSLSLSASGTARRSNHRASALNPRKRETNPDRTVVVGPARPAKGLPRRLAVPGAAEQRQAGCAPLLIGRPAGWPGAKASPR
jgi:hypothetical protein